MASPYDILARATQQARKGEFMEALETVEFAAKIAREFPALANKESFREMAIAANHYIWELMDKDKPGVAQYVYFIADGNRRLVKIGISSDPKFRLSQLQTANGVRLKTLKVVLGGKELEGEIHLKFAHLNTSGEWFRASKELMEYIEGL